MLDLTGLGAWRALPFFADELPTLEKRLGADILPPEEKVFAALEQTSPDATRVVILGQDPYHTPGKADGLAFSIPDAFGGKLDSLGNIFKEIQSDTGSKRTKTSLNDWAAQGVLLLNTALTVPPGKPKAHAKLGWDKLVSQVLDRLDSHPRAFIFWGAPAQRYARSLRDHHLVITSPHPSPLSAYRGFFGSRPFSRVNRWLIEQGQEPINWADP
ncbi:uracil-DNA glycosylase [Yoonia litorea]|uniref:Uracil-DNA glycosylase n=1 Tax=Yoonia litorea TaxID=1123755 RepID=A0A1I6MA85_9RHOB|nr:uracil-DNA glycosylase [Yoonia litorea]SFS12625.1 Uracil-DNA glycosylase [Yoonia litorea]